MTTLEDIESLLKTNQLRITRTRLAVASILLKYKEQPLTSEEIFKKIEKSKKLNCDKVSVYRILSTYEEIGLIKKGIFQGEASRYLLVNQNKKLHKHEHEHYFKCIRCNYIEPFHDCFVSRKEKELEKNGFKELQHHLEITGLCPKCANR